MNLIQETLVLIFGVVIASLFPLTQYTINGGYLLLGLFAYIQARRNGISLAELGLKPSFNRTFQPWLQLTIGLLIAVTIIKTLFPSGIYSDVIPNRQAYIYIVPIYIFFGSLLQELYFRGYFFARVKPYMSIFTATLLNVALFSFFHLPYIVQLHSNLFYLSIIVGIVWSIYYAKYPNLYLSWASHAIVGSAALLLLQSV